MKGYLIILCGVCSIYNATSFKFSMLMGPDIPKIPRVISSVPKFDATNSMRRLNALGAASFLGGIFNGGKANAADGSKQPTNAVIKLVDGIKQKRLGGGDIIVSELGLGTQRWVSDDFNAPDEKLCLEFMDRAILQSGVNFIDTAESYPIPSSLKNPEGKVEQSIYL